MRSCVSGRRSMFLITPVGLANVRYCRKRLAELNAAWPEERRLAIGIE